MKAHIEDICNVAESKSLTYQQKLFNLANVAERLEELARRIGRKDFCIDAEGGLRNKVTEIYGQDFLDINQAKGYLSNALKAFNKL